MTTPLSNQIIREITPLSDKDCLIGLKELK